MTAFRLSKGGRIDRSQPIYFRFDGKDYRGFKGDTLASALLANNVRVIGRSFKYHRKRGLIAAGFDEPNAVTQIGEEPRLLPNVKATQVLLSEGLEARSVNAWPSLKFDLLSINALFKRFLPAGFYYKTFMWPDWHWFEPAIRKAAGLGRSPENPDPDTYDKRYAEFDVLIIGGGISGLFAARIAAKTGARVCIVDADREWGGAALIEPIQIDQMDGAEWCEQEAERLAALPNVTLLKNTMAFGYYDHNLMGLVERLSPTSKDNSVGPRERMWKIRAKGVVLATGAFERPLVFPNNDRPGVMLASAGLAYAYRFGVSPGKKIVVATNNDGGYQTALSLSKLGVEVAAVIDARLSAISDLTDQVTDAGIEVVSSATVTDIRGRDRVRSVELHKLDENGKPKIGHRRTLECDCVLTSSGWSPAVHLFSQSGGKLRFDDETQSFLPDRSSQTEISIGAASGVFNWTKALNKAQSKTANLLHQIGFTASVETVPSTDHRDFGEIKPLWSVDVDAIGRPSAKAWVDFQNDVTASDVKLALRENFRSVEHVKRYTTLGMASDQGKTSNVNGIGIMSDTLGREPSQIGTTKFRPPYNPVTIGTFAGRRVGENLQPLRSLPSVQTQIRLCAKLDDYAGWTRPASYAPNGESEHEAVSKEVLATRGGVGLFDASPLGEIEVFGPDAATFLNRIYVNNMKTLKPGRCRYGLMLNENGIIMDDGILACLGEGHYQVGTTSGNASMIADMLQEWLQCEWLDLDVATTNVTTNWAVMNVNGPRSRDLLSLFNSDIDFSAEAFAHMHLRQGMIEGVPCRVQRVSFSGELSYEVAVPWGHGASFYEALMERGAPLGITPIGLEALMAMRIEKGFLHVGSDTDGMTLPQDVGFARIIEKKQDDFIGRRSTMRPDAMRENRRHLVGLEAIDEKGVLPIGSHIVAEDTVPPTASQGWVTSSVLSPTLNKPVALGLVENGRDRMGEDVVVWDLGQRRRARIVATGAFDPKGEQLNG